MYTFRTKRSSIVTLAVCATGDFSVYNYDNFVGDVMKEEYYIDEIKGDRMFHNGIVQAFGDKDKLALYGCFMEKNRIGRYLLSLNKKDAKILVEDLQKWIRE